MFQVYPEKKSFGDFVGEGGLAGSGSADDENHRQVMEKLVTDVTIHFRAKLTNPKEKWQIAKHD